MIDLVLQTDPRLNVMINSYGCFYRSVLGIAETHLQTGLNAGEIESIYQMAVEMGADFMLPDCTLKRYAAGGALAVVGFRYMRHHEFDCRQVGSISADSFKVSWWGPRKYNYTVLLGRTVNGNRHYRLGDSSGTLIFDPNPRATIHHEVLELLYLVERV